MVLAPAVKQTVFISLGAFLGAIVGPLLSAPVNFWYMRHSVTSDDEQNLLVLFLLFGVLPLSIIAGGAVGHCLFKRQR